MQCIYTKNNVYIYFLKVVHYFNQQGNQRWQTSPAAPPGGLGHCHTGMCMSNFMMIGWEMAEILHIEISRKHVSVTYDLDLWPKILKIFVSHGVPIRNMYAKFHNDRLRNGWDITLWNFAKTRTNKQTHTHTHTNKHTHTQTHRHGHYNTSPSPYGGRGNNNYLSVNNLYGCSEFQSMYQHCGELLWLIRNEPMTYVDMGIIFLVHQNSNLSYPW